jgi:Gpi18-like mannosyltransferase
MLRPRIILLTVASWLALHTVIWLLVYRFEPTIYPYARDVNSMLEHWDAWHYNAIIKEGYSGIRWAFYPLYPMLIRALAWFAGLQARPEIAGTIFSTLAFAAFCLAQSRLITSAAPDEQQSLLTPASIWGWLFFLFSPASWVFHSHHTESLFLFLSFFAFFCASRGRWQTAAVIAGLCALTRNQGVFVAVAVALDSALRQKENHRRALVFGGSGLISFLLFACYTAYQFRATGDALLFVHIQSQWGVVNSFHQYIGTLWFANTWQHADWKGYLYLLFFFIVNGAAIAMLIRKEYPFALYVLLSMWAPLYSGHLHNTYRYSAVLFPALFLLGDSLRRLPPPVRVALFGLLLWLNIIYTRHYAWGAWAY